MTKTEEKSRDLAERNTLGIARIVEEKLQWQAPRQHVGA